MPVGTLVVLGSGGHTAEILTLVGQLDKSKYVPRCYVAAVTDRLGHTKALAAEDGFRTTTTKGKRAAGCKPSDQVALATIPRSREVGQSYLTSVWTTLRALLAAFVLVYRVCPELVLVNGPGTCIPICAAAYVFRLFLFRPCRIVYVESIARVKSLSLSGKILYHMRMADAIFVQWPDLLTRYSRAQCCGRLY
ncbi:hypothetical protein WJX72_009106 [[Myrmecia] bisecta]|uniref:UDP-N-acetylglucosamine transferase subunit ALG14 n=1 Tax=[Myrmecia] bisecta TaxID=41462 RepID=A0AAW1R8X2_9CHLO